MKRIETKLKKMFPEAEILKDVKSKFYFVKPAFCDEEKEKLIKESHPDINIVNTTGADGQGTIFIF